MLDAVASPALTLGASPRNAAGASQGLQMARNVSKGGPMLPPQSPATGLQRSTTPKPGKSGQTPKSVKEEGLVSGERPCADLDIARLLIVSARATYAQIAQSFAEQCLRPHAYRLSTAFSYAYPFATEYRLWLSVQISNHPATELVVAPAS